MDYKILISDSVHEKGINLLRERKNFLVDERPNLSRGELKAIISNYDALVVRSTTVVDREVLQEASRLRIIGRAGTGLDNIDVAEATRRGIIVMNVPGGNAIATAEHTLGLIMSAHAKFRKQLLR